MTSRVVFACLAVLCLSASVVERVEASKSFSQFRRAEKHVDETPVTALQTACAEHQQCDSCVAEAGCGWCWNGDSAGSCHAGSIAAPQVGECAAPHWSYAVCTPPPASTPTEEQVKEGEAEAEENPAPTPHAVLEHELAEHDSAAENPTDEHEHTHHADPHMPHAILEAAKIASNGGPIQSDRPLTTGYDSVLGENTLIDKVVVANSLDIGQIRFTPEHMTSNPGHDLNIKPATNQRVAIDGFTALGSTAPAIKMRTLDLRMPNLLGGSASAKHDVELEKIISVNVVVSSVSNGHGVIFGQSNPHDGRSYYHWWVDTQKVYIQRDQTSTRDANLLDNADVKITIIYTN
eukprot:GILK01000146.1.p1 GENE.GILK01000146.1~~GILK01000146.1.p1  ORF type:complete len:363 (+),score=69.28 GILK01000146.1:48-1091(+)